MHQHRPVLLRPGRQSIRNPLGHIPHPPPQIRHSLLFQQPLPIPPPSLFHDVVHPLPKPPTKPLPRLLDATHFLGIAEAEVIRSPGGGETSRGEGQEGGVAEGGGVELGEGAEAGEGLAGGEGGGLEARRGGEGLEEDVSSFALEGWRWRGRGGGKGGRGANVRGGRGFADEPFEVVRGVITFRNRVAKAGPRFLFRIRRRRRRQQQGNELVVKPHFRPQIHEGASHIRPRFVGVRRGSDAFQKEFRFFVVVLSDVATMRLRRAHDETGVVFVTPSVCRVRCRHFAVPIPIAVAVVVVVLQFLRDGAGIPSQYPRSFRIGLGDDSVGVAVGRRGGYGALENREEIVVR
mmetsp:Transcript_30945/g.65745  ORF Transcript_30945/g.65745 Transcript_30945/m.65745 type:complete len:348 (-) Transcript_30945:49-1092(-)